MAIFGEGRRSIATIWMEDAQLQVLIDGEIWETHPDVHVLVLNSFVANQFFNFGTAFYFSLLNSERHLLHSRKLAPLMPK
jgi:hypothetical protein